MYEPVYPHHSLYNRETTVGECDQENADASTVPFYSGRYLEMWGSPRTSASVAKTPTSAGAIG